LHAFLGGGEGRFRLTFLASRVRGQFHASRLIRRVPAIVGVAAIVFAIPSSDVNSWEWVAPLLVAGCIAIVGLFVTARTGATPPTGAK
jgi:hypothetical protein